MSKVVDFLKYFKKKQKAGIALEGRPQGGLPPWCIDRRVSPHPEMGVYANKGEIITCEGDTQHIIAEFLVDVCFGQTMDVDNQIGNWRQPVILAGEASSKCVCTVCGNRWYDGWGAFHVTGGWRI